MEDELLTICGLNTPCGEPFLCGIRLNPHHSAYALWVMLASSMIPVCTSPEHWVNPVSLINSEVVEQHAGLARAGTFLNTADIVARWGLLPLAGTGQVQALQAPVIETWGT